MKNYVIILISILVFSCSENKPNAKCIVKITKFNNSRIIISILNNSNEKLYIPNIGLLPIGLRFISISGKDTNDITTCIFERSFNLGSLEENNDYNKIIMYNSAEKVKSLNLDSVASEISKSNNKYNISEYRRISYIHRKLREAIYIEPNEKFEEFFPIIHECSDNLTKVYFSYPYKYPVFDSNLISKEEFLFDEKTRDSLSFTYPEEIQGYKLFDSSIKSNFVKL